MRILQSTPYLDPKMGGQERHVLALSEKLLDLGHDVTLLACGKCNSHIVPHSRVHKINSKRLLGLNIVSIRELNNFIKTNKFDVCHLHYQTIFGEIVPFVNKISRLPTVTTLHSQMVRSLPAKLFYDSVSLRYISAVSRKVICLSSNIMQNLVKRGLDYFKCAVIPNALDVHALESQFSRIRKEACEPTFDLLFVGRLEQRKGVNWLLKSLSLLHKQGRKLRLRIIGHGPQINEIRETIKSNNLETYVELLGYVSHSELLKSYLLAKVVVIPSLFEGIPTVALESMAARKPLIVSNIPGLNELVIHKGNGLIVNPLDTRGLALAIDSIVTCRSSLSSLNSLDRKILMRFDWGSVTQSIIGTYREILNDN